MRKDDGVSTITKLGFVRNDALYDVSLAKSKQYCNSAKSYITKRCKKAEV